MVQTIIFIEISTHWGPEEYSEPWHIQNSGIFRTLAYWEPEAYSEPWNIETLTNLEAYDTENPGIFRTPAFWKPVAYSEPCQITTMEYFARSVSGYNYFRE